jgi:hypothetical protein
MREDYAKLWAKIHGIISEYPGYFPGDYATLEATFKWAYELVVGRCFGWSLP